MKEFKKRIIIGVDHGYVNIKTASHCFKAGIDGYDEEPIFTKDMLIYDGRYYLIGEGHKEFLPDKIKDEDYYLLTLAAVATELKDKGITGADIIIAAGLPLTWTSGQKSDFIAYLSRKEEVSFTYHFRTGIRFGIDIFLNGYKPNTERRVLDFKILSCFQIVSSETAKHSYQPGKSFQRSCILCRLRCQAPFLCGKEFTERSRVFPLFQLQRRTGKMPDSLYPECSIGKDRTGSHQRHFRLYPML